MMRKVLQVNPTTDFKVYVYFDDGKIKIFDMTPFLNKGVFRQISDVENFLGKCTVLNGTLAWDLSGKFDPTQCIDMDPETVYETGIDVADPLEQQCA